MTVEFEDQPTKIQCKQRTRLLVKEYAAKKNIPVGDAVDNIINTFFAIDNGDDGDDDDR